MTAVYFVSGTLALFIGFLLLVGYEARRGVRFFATSRQRLDAKVARISFVIAHVDFGSFVQATLRDAAARIAHDAAHLSLLLTRSLERLLTKAVRALRAREQALPDAKPQASVYATSMLDFKRRLRKTSKGADVSSETDAS